MYEQRDRLQGRVYFEGTGLVFPVQVMTARCGRLWRSVWSRCDKPTSPQGHGSSYGKAEWISPTIKAGACPFLGEVQERHLLNIAPPSSLFLRARLPSPRSCTRGPRAENGTIRRGSSLAVKCPWDYLPSDGKEAAIVSDAPRLEVLTREVMKKLHVSSEAHNLLRFPGRRFDS